MPFVHCVARICSVLAKSSTDPFNLRSDGHMLIFGSLTSTATNRASEDEARSNNPQNVRLGLGCGQQWLSKPSCPNSEDKCKAGPDWGQGVAWQGCYGDRAGLDREEMLNEAIVWPK